MKYSSAHQKALSGLPIRRKGWNAPNQYVFLIPGSTLTIQPAWLSQMGIKKTTPVKDVFAIFNAQGEVQAGWVPSQGDMNADDWEVVDLAPPAVKDLDALPKVKRSKKVK